MDRHELTYLVLAASELYEVPIHPLIAIMQQESNGDPTAINKANRNGTNDVGLFQLNSRTFPGLDRYNIRKNIQGACEHLVNLHEQYGSWDEAVLYYNGFSKAGVNYQSNILASERILDSEFHVWRYTRGQS